MLSEHEKVAIDKSSLYVVLVKGFPREMASLYLGMFKGRLDVKLMDTI